VFIFILQLAYPPLTSLFIFDPTRALSEPWLFITSIFLHGGLLHLFFNGYALVVFGSVLERRLDTNAYLILFFLSGIAGSILYLLTVLLGIAPPIPALGASGAIYGILGAVSVFAPNMIVYVWYLPMRMREAAIFWIILEFIGTFNTASGIASAAHLGGLLFGLAYANYIKRKEETFAF
jgi:membrane associated rhomboid family serine protease